MNAQVGSLGAAIMPRIGSETLVGGSGHGMGKAESAGARRGSRPRPTYPNELDDNTIQWPLRLPSHHRLRHVAIATTRPVHLPVVPQAKPFADPLIDMVGNRRLMRHERNADLDSYPVKRRDSHTRET